jgi:hypothetical protein
MPQHRIAACGRYLGAVDPHSYPHPAQLGQGVLAYRRPEHERLLLPVIGHRQGKLPREVAAGFDDLERRMHSADRGGYIRTRRIGRQVAIKNDAELILEAGLDQCIPAKDMARSD